MNSQINRKGFSHLPEPDGINDNQAAASRATPAIESCYDAIRTARWTYTPGTRR